MATCPSCGQNLGVADRFCSACGRPQPEAAHGADGTHGTEGERRKPITVLCCDLVDSTSLAEQLDVESYDVILNRYFLLAERTIVAHGGQVEKYIGDAVFAVFGLDKVRRDDASRAVGAAAEIQRQLSELNRELLDVYRCRIAVRITLNTGEVVVKGNTLAPPLVAGDVGNVAARLHEAVDGQVIVTEATLEALSTVVETESLGSVSLRGRQETVRAHVVRYPPADTSADGFIGRRAELATLRNAFDRCQHHGRWEVVVVGGRRGIGKSRLVERFLAEVGFQATVVGGRCRAEGEGPALAPVIEIVEALLSGRPRDASDLQYALAGLTGQHPEIASIARTLGSLLGVVDAAATVPEIAWALRIVVESIAARQPVVMVIDDLHLARASVTAVVEQMVAKAAPIPVLVVCVRRTEREHAATPGLLFADDETLVADLTTIEVNPLPNDESEPLIDARSHGDLSAELFAQVVETADGGVPASLKAVVHAHLDALPAEAVTCLEHVSVAGGTFDIASAKALLAEVQSSDETLRLLRFLVDEGLLTELTVGNRLAFAHDDVRSVAYGRITKRRRADLHRRYGDWSEAAAGDGGVPDDELVGYHLEQAYHYHQELSAVGPAERSLAERAAARFHGAALSALARADAHGAIALLYRCRDLSEAARFDVDPLLGSVLGEAGRGSEALALLERHAATASARGERLAATLGQVESMIIQMQTDPRGVSARLLAEEADLLAILEWGSSSAGLARIWHLKGQVEWHRLCCAEAATAWRRAGAHAGYIGDRRRESEAFDWQASSVVFGPKPTNDGIAFCQELLDGLVDDRLVAAQVRRSMACLYAMRGEHQIASFLIGESDQAFDLVDGRIPHREAFASILAGDLIGARSRLVWDIDQLRNIDNRAVLSASAAMLAHVLIAEGDLAEAEALTALGEQAGDIDSVATQISWRTAQAKCRAAAGELTDAIGMASTALEMAESTDSLVMIGDCHSDLASVHQGAGTWALAKRHLAAANDAYEAKGHLVGVRRCGQQLNP